MSYPDYTGPRDSTDWPAFIDDQAKKALMDTVRDALKSGPRELWQIVDSCDVQLEGNLVQDARFAAVERACRAVADPVWQLIDKPTVVDEPAKAKNDPAYKWTVEFEVDPIWVADGFDLDDERALDMLSHDLDHANIAAELSAKVLSAPDPKRIKKEQGY